MTYRSVLLLLALFFVCACASGARDATIADRSQAEGAGSTQSIEERLENFNSYFRYRKFPPNCAIAADQSLQCEGDVLRNPEAPPDDWIPFEFNGETYYFRPLAKSASGG